MSGCTDHSLSNPAYIHTGALNATKYTSWAGAAIVAIGAIVIGVAKAASAEVSTTVVVAILGTVAIALLAIAVVVAADVLARGRVKCCAIAAGVANGMVPAGQAVSAGANGVDGDATLTVGDTRFAFHKVRSVDIG